MIQCRPILEGPEYVCSVCGWGCSKGFKEPFSRNCGESKETYSRPFYLGDGVGRALSLAGVTEERVSKWLGRPCGCKKRRERLNQLDRWVRRRVRGLFRSDEDAVADLEEILDQ